MSEPSPQYSSRAVCAPAGKSRVTPRVLVSHSGNPNTVNTCGRTPANLAYLVSGNFAFGFADRFTPPGPRYWTYTQTQRTKLLYIVTGTFPPEYPPPVVVG